MRVVITSFKEMDLRPVEFEDKVNDFIDDLTDGRTEYDNSIGFQLIMKNGNNLMFHVKPFTYNCVMYDGKRTDLVQFISQFDMNNIDSLYYYSVEVDKFVDTGIKF